MIQENVLHSICSAYRIRRATYDRLSSVHKVFVSYAHRLDQENADKFLELSPDKKDVFIDKSLHGDVGHLSDGTIQGKIRELIKDTTVTVVLIGEETAERWWIDWEIYYSLRQQEGKTRNGILGIYLPNKIHHIPDRLQDNKHMAVMVDWPKTTYALQNHIEDAFKRRDLMPDLSRPLRQRNSSRGL